MHHCLTEKRGYNEGTIFNLHTINLEDFNDKKAEKNSLFTIGTPGETLQSWCRYFFVHADHKLEDPTIAKLRVVYNIFWHLELNQSVRNTI